MCPKMNILLVEDNSGDALLLQEVLSEHPQISITRAGDLAEGIHLARTTPFDVVLLDLGLPDSIGTGTVSSIAAACPNLPVVVMTGLEDDSVAVRAKELGADGYLLKGDPDPSVVLDTISAAIMKKSPQA